MNWAVWWGRLATAVIVTTTILPVPIITAYIPHHHFGGIATVRGMLFVPVSSPLTRRVPSMYVSTATNDHEINRGDNDDSDDDGDEPNGDNALATMELQNKLVYIEALEERNKAQLGSFLDEEDQWDSLEDFERELLLSKEALQKQLEELNEAQ